MVDLVEISKDRLFEIIKFSYDGDADLLKKYHIKKFNLNEAVASTYDMIEVTEKSMQLKYFGLFFKNKYIGYTITSGNHLYSFAVNINYRTKEILTEWWYEVKDLLGDSFSCLLFSNNIRAINYLKKRGMKIAWENTEHEKLNEVLLTY